MKAVIIAILCLCPSLAFAQVSYKPSLATDECATAPDKFLCRALRKGLELAEQQLNCEVVQAYSQRDWNGKLLTKRPDEYYVRVEKGLEVFYKVGANDELGAAQTRPDYQAVKIYAQASWYSTPAALFRYAEFSNKRLAPNGNTVYSFKIGQHFDLSSGYLKTAVAATGEVEFDKAGLLRRLYLEYEMLPDQMKRHKFKVCTEETIFDNPKGFEEVMPVPVKFWAKSSTTYGTKAIIEVAYSDYTRFDSDIVFLDGVEETKPKTKRRIDGKTIEVKE